MLLLVMVTLAIAGVVLLYVAYPYRGESMPWHPEIGDALKRGVDAFPTLDSPPKPAGSSQEKSRVVGSWLKRHSVSPQG